MIAPLLLAAVLQTAPAPQNLDRVVRLSFIPAIAAHMWEFAETVECLDRGTCREMNPALRWAEDSTMKLSLAKGAMTGALQLIPYHIAKRGGKWKWVALGYNIGQTVAFSLIAHHNGKFSDQPR